MRWQSRGSSLSLPDRLHDEGSERDVRHEVAVHHVEMQEVRSAGGDFLDVLLQPAKIGAQEAGGDLYHAGIVGYTAVKRLIRNLVLLGLVLCALWFFGRAPTAFVLEEECRRFQQDRRVTDGALSVRIAKLETDDPANPELPSLRAARKGKQVALRRMTMRGWDVLLIPTGGTASGAERLPRLGLAERVDPRRCPGRDGADADLASAQRHACALGVSPWAQPLADLTRESCRSPRRFRSGRGRPRRAGSGRRRGSAAGPRP